MAKANETINTTGPVLYRANYQYVAKNHQLRGGTIVVEADSTDSAKEKALKTIAELGLQNYRLTSVKPF